MGVGEDFPSAAKDTNNVIEAPDLHNPLIIRFR